MCIRDRCLYRLRWSVHTLNWLVLSGADRWLECSPLWFWTWCNAERRSLLMATCLRFTGHVVTAVVVFGP
eukprot:233562-Prorocentrum_lima.AAC.1